MTQEKVPFNVFGNLDEPVSKYMKRAPAMEAVDRTFLDSAKKALREVAQTALGFLFANPEISEQELTRRLNHGANGFGLVMAIYEEAEEIGVVRGTAKDLLLRWLRARFPDGWISKGKVHPHVKIGHWARDIEQYVRDKQMGEYAHRILKELAIDHPPPQGWKPLSKNDPLIDSLFDRFWPVETSSTASC
jgi:hypothetical protein